MFIIVKKNLSLKSQLASLLNRRVNATAVVFFKNTLSSNPRKK